MGEGSARSFLDVVNICALRLEIIAQCVGNLTLVSELETITRRAK